MSQQFLTSRPTVALLCGRTQPVEYAETELNRYLARIFPKPSPEDALEITLALDECGRLGDEAYEIATTDSGVAITGGSELGLVFGVFGFLREVCGCSFAGLGPDSEHVPVAQRLPLPDTAILRKPLLWYRGLQCSRAEPPELDRRRLDWMVRNGLNYLMVRLDRDDSAERVTLDPMTGEPVSPKGAKVFITETWFREHLLPEVLRRGIKLDIGHHNLLYWLPPTRYQAQHPEWYAEADGARGKVKDQLCVCTSNPQAVAEIISNARKALKEYPAASIIGIIPEDGYGMCQCKACVAQDADPKDAFRKPGDHRLPEGENRSLANRYARLLNAVAKEIGKEFPSVTIGGGAYINLQWPPRDVQLEMNTVTWVALYWRDGCRPLAAQAGSRFNRFFDDLLRQWRGSFRGKLILYEYYMGMKAQRSMPYPMSRVICADWPALRRLGVDGATIQCWSENHQSYALNMLAFARCGWQERVDHAALLDEFLLGIYGHAARHVRPIYTALLDALDAVAAHAPDQPSADLAGIPNGVLQPDGVNIRHFLKAVEAIKPDEHVRCAVQSATDEREKRQLADLERMIAYWRLAATVFDKIAAAEQLPDAQRPAALKAVAELAMPPLLQAVHDEPPRGWIARNATESHWRRLQARLGQNEKKTNS